MERSDQGGRAPDQPRQDFVDETGKCYRGVTAMPAVVEAEMFRSIAISSQSGLMASDETGRIVWVNTTLAKMVGRPAEEMIGQPFTIVLDEKVHDHIREVRRRLVAGEELGTFRIQGRHRDGHVFPLSVTPGVRRDAAGHYLGVVTILRDITEEVAVERSRDEILARFRARFDRLGIAQAVLDMHGRFLEVNEAACELLDRPREELLGREVLPFGAPEHESAVLERVRELVAGGGAATCSYETEALLPDGRRRPILIDLGIVRDPDGDPAEMVFFARDLSEIRAAESRLLSQQRLFQVLYERSADPALITDAAGKVVFASPSFEHVMGVPVHEAVGQYTFDNIHPDDVEEARGFWERVLASPGATQRALQRGRSGDGSYPWFDVSAMNAVDDPDIRGVVLNLHNVDEAVRAQQALRESEARYRAVVETAQEGILVIDAGDRVVLANQRLAEILGLPLDRVYGLPAARFRPVGGEPQQRPERGPLRYDVDYHHPDGRTRILDVAAGPFATGEQHADSARDGGWIDLPGPEAATGTVLMVSDVTELRRTSAELRRQALEDPLTRLANRTLLVDRMRAATARQQRRGNGALALLYLDLDHFKQINDGYGHEVGDQVLAAVASRLRESLRGADTVARIGGDEFAVFCAEDDPRTAGLVASRIEALLKDPVELDDRRLEVGVSIGVATSPPVPPEDLLRSADVAMYRAKTSGRGRVVVFEGDLDGGPDAPGR